MLESKVGYMYKIDIHADDYAYSLATSKDIIDCLRKGCLDSFSIICNLPAFDECMELLYKEIPNLPFLPLISIHLDFPEGDSISDNLPLSWSNLFLSSYSFNRNKIKKELKKEIKRQIDKTQGVINKCIDIARNSGVEAKQSGIRIDSHIHTHLIPVVWDSLIEVIEEEKYDIEYIRNPLEPLNIFLNEKSLIKTYSFVNIIKNRILAFYSKKVDKYCDSHNLPKMYMWGLVMSSHMDFDRIKILLDSFKKKAQDDDRVLELLFHPGKANEDEYCKEMNKDYFRDANTSNNRHIEKESVLKVKNLL